MVAKYLHLRVKGVVYNSLFFCQIQQISSHCPRAFRSVCALKKRSGVIHSPGSVNGKQTEWPRPSHQPVLVPRSSNADAALLT